MSGVMQLQAHCLGGVWVHLGFDRVRVVLLLFQTAGQSLLGGRLIQIDSSCWEKMGRANPSTRAGCANLKAFQMAGVWAHGAGETGRRRGTGLSHLNQTQMHEDGKPRRHFPTYYTGPKRRRDTDKSLYINVLWSNRRVHECFFWWDFLTSVQPHPPCHPTIHHTCLFTFFSPNYLASVISTPFGISTPLSHMAVITHHPWGYFVHPITRGSSHSQNLLARSRESNHVTSTHALLSCSSLICTFPMIPRSAGMTQLV